MIVLHNNYVNYYHYTVFFTMCAASTTFTEGFALCTRGSPTGTLRLQWRRRIHIEGTHLLRSQTFGP